MLINLEQLRARQVHANDGDIGKIKDIIFDDEHWTVRFFVLDTHPWMPLSKKVLISPISILKIEENSDDIILAMSKQMVEDSPKVEDQETVSREFELRYFDHFGYSYYWLGSHPWGDYTYPSALTNQNMIVTNELKQNDIEKTNHLREVSEVSHYNLHASDGDKGHVHDFIWDSKGWSLKYLVVDTSNWFIGGKRVLVPCDKIDSISWEKKTVECKLSKEEINACPEL